MLSYIHVYSFLSASELLAGGKEKAKTITQGQTISLREAETVISFYFY